MKARDLQVADYMCRNVYSLPASASFAQARELMESHRIRQVPVVDAEGALQGIVTQRDLYGASLSKLSENYERGRALLDSQFSVAEIMTEQVLTVLPTTSLSDVALLLHEKRVGACPVLERGRLVGIISSTDLLAIFASLLCE